VADCNVCSAAVGTPVYRSQDGRSLTSLSEFYDGPTEVFFCARCGHLQTTEIQDIQKYYDTQYNIFVDSDEEDLLYKVVDGKKLFRVEHQVQTILDKLSLPEGARVLDFGCAKSATSRKLLEARPDLKVHLFDVSEAYVKFWQKFLGPDRWSTYRPKPEWSDSFDAVFSFFAMEHTADPRAFASDLARLIKPGGQLHLLVPNVYANTADFVVVDHVNHFSAASLGWLFASVGFDVVSIDDQAHDAAFVVTARKAQGKSFTPDAAEIAGLRRRVDEMSGFWSGLAGRVRAFERENRAAPAAIYGSGFYGTFIASCLEDLSNVVYFLDQSEFRQAKRLLDKPILAPEKIDSTVEAIYVGLNPRIARGVIESLEALRARRCFYP
jgi:2-polyprenyl-3-methyl-5-hydroxy-6-metoxy-1,4-benzoquinol methylase